MAFCGLDWACMFFVRSRRLVLEYVEVQVSQGHAVTMDCEYLGVANHGQVGFAVSG